VVPDDGDRLADDHGQLFNGGVGAGAEVEFTVREVTNMASAVGTFGVSTSADTTPASVAITTVSPGTVTNVTASPSTSAAGATSVDYTVDLTTSASGQLADNEGTITFTAPMLTSFALGGCVTATIPSDGTEWCPTSGVGTRSVTGVVFKTGTGTAVGAGETLEFVIRGVTNTTTVGAQTLSVSTSSDGTGISNPAYNIVAASNVTNLSVTPSTTAAGATQVEYTVDFMTSATGQLADNQGTITVTGPANTIFTTAACAIMTSPNTGVEWCPETGIGTRSVTGVVFNTGTGVAIGANQDVNFVIDQVTNGPSAGGQAMTVSTSSDAAQTVNPAFTLTTANALTNVAVSLSTTAASASQVSYTVDFTTSATGQLDDGNGLITLTGPVGTAFTDDSCVTFTLPNNGTEWCPITGIGTRSIAGEVFDTGSGAILGATDIEMTVRGVTNTSSTGLQTFTASTSSDTAANTSFSLVSPAAVTGQAASVSTTAATASQVNYTIDFTTTAHGALADEYGTATFTGPAGTIFASDSCETLTIPADGSEWCPSTGIGTNSVTGIFFKSGSVNAIGNGESVELTLQGETNTSTTGPQHLSISTSSDPLPVQAAFSLTSPNPVSNASVTTDSTLPGQSNVNYTIDFRTSATGQLVDNFGEATFTGPIGTDFSSNACVTLTIPSTGIDWCPETGIGTNSVTGVFVLSGNGIVLGPSTSVELTLTGVTNTSSTGIQHLTVTTTSDTVPVNAPIAIGPLTAPQITSANNATLSNGVGGTFQVTATGVPIPSLASSSLPAGVTFTDNHDGTATLAVSPSVAATTLTPTFTASNGVAPDAQQSFTLTILPPAPVVSHISPTFGPATGGTTVTITGMNFTNAQDVSFGGVEASNFVVNSDTQITATSPQHDSGIFDIFVANLGGTSSPNANDKFTFDKVDQTITFGALSDKTLLQSPVTVGATATSGLPVTFTTTTPLVCTAGGTNGTHITLLMTGLCTVEADQAGNTIFNAAPPVTQSFNVTSGVTETTSTTTTTTTTPSTTTTSTTSTSTTTTSTTSSTTTTTRPSTTTTTTTTTTTPSTTTTTTTVPPTTTTTSTTTSTSTTSTTTTSTSTTTTTRPSTTTTTTTTAPTTAPTTSTSTTTTTTTPPQKQDQTITFPALPDVTLAASPVTASATATSGLPVTFTTTTPLVCTAGGTNGSQITLLITGKCTVQADQAGDATFNAAPSVTQSFQVIPVATTTTTSTTTTSTTTPSTSTTTTTTTTSTSTTTTTRPSTTTTTTTAPTTSTSTTTTTTTPPQKQDQTITFPALPDVTLAASPVTASATATSGLPVTFTTTTPLVCTAGGTNGSQITLLTTGKCTVQADQAGDAAFNAAPSVTQSFQVIPVATTTTTSTTTTSTTTPSTTTTTTTTAPTTTTTTRPSTTTTTTAPPPTTTTTSPPPSTTTTTSPAACDRPGNGFGDKNHVHCGPPGQINGNGKGHGGRTEFVSLREAVTGHAAAAVFGLIVMIGLCALAIVRRRTVRRPAR
jgi:hypothetical protein